MKSQDYVLDIVNLGCDAMDQEDFPAAHKYFELAVKGGSAVAVFNLGNLFKAQEQLQSAEGAYRKALDLGVVEAGLNLGRVLEELGRLDEAETAYRDAWASGDEVAGDSLAWLLDERGDRKAAGKVFEEMSRADSYIGRQAAGTLGVWRSIQGRNNKKTRRLLKRGLWAYQDAAPQMAQILISQGHFQRARELLEEHITYSPRPSVVLGNLLLDHFGDTDAAAAAYRIGADAGDSHSADNLARLEAP